MTDPYQDQRRAHGTMLARLNVADFAVPQPRMLAELRAHLALVATRLDPAAADPRRAELAMLEIAIRAVAGADGAGMASANGDRLTTAFGRFVAADLALLAAPGARER